jgi:uncharacterized membrane protein
MDPIQERMDALTAANVRLLRRVEALERRLAEMEGLTGPTPLSDEAPPEPARGFEVEDAPEEVLAARAVEEARPVEETKPVEEAWPAEPAWPVEQRDDWEPQESLESRVGLNWINRVGAITLTLGAAFFFKYAIDNDWIGPTGRILLGVLAGAMLCAFGFRSWRQTESTFAQGVTASGLAVLYLSFWASFSLYHLTPALFAFSLMVAVTILGGAFAWLYGSQALGVLSYMSGLSAPFLTSSGEYLPWFLTLYLAVLGACWLFFARRQNWNGLEWAAAAGAFLPFLPVLNDLQPGDRKPVGTAWLLLQYAIFVRSPVTFLTAAAQAAAPVGIALTYDRSTALGLAVLAVLLVGGLGVSWFRRLPWLPLVAFSGFVAGYAILRVFAPQPLPVAPLLLWSVAATVATVAFAVRPGAAEALDEWYGLLLLVAPSTFCFLAGYEALSHGLEAWRGVFAAGVAGAYLLLGLTLQRRGQDEEAGESAIRPVLFCVGASLVLATTAVAIQFSGFRITILWALQAAALSWLGAKYGQGKLHLAVVGLTGLVLLRLGAIDTPAYLGHLDLAPLANPRCLAHLASGAALAAAAWWMRPGRMAALPYLAAHAAILHGLAWEIHSWVIAGTAPEAQNSAISSGLTILGAVYGLTLVAAGVLGRFPLNRLLGLGLLAAVVSKLYLVDVWSMQRLHRIVAFGVLGLLLLATSYFYSHFRTKIEDWIKHDEPGNPSI